MDDTDRAVREELARRLAALELEEREQRHPPFPRADMIVLIAIVALSVVLGLVTGLA
jgi:hypothetical protein